MPITTIYRKEEDAYYQDGVEVGVVRGEARGRQEEALEIAREMKNDKFPNEKIAKLTKLSIEEIESL